MYAIYTNNIKKNNTIVELFDTFIPTSTFDWSTFHILKTKMEFSLLTKGNIQKSKFTIICWSLSST